MTIDPKARQLARQLGHLLGAYVPEAREGHVMIELIAALQEGIADAARHPIPRLDLPMRKSVRQQDGDLTFDLDAERSLVLYLTGSMVSAARGEKDREIPLHLYFDSDDIFSAIVHQLAREPISVPLKRP